MDEAPRFVRNANVFTVTIKNFNERINREGLLVPHGEFCGLKWNTDINKNSIYGVSYLGIEPIAGIYPHFGLSGRKFSTELAICVKNEKRWEKRQERFEHYGWIGWDKFMRMDTILDPDSGFLTEDGSLMIRIELRIDGISDLDGNEIFDFFVPFKGNVRISVNFMKLYTYKQVLVFYSPVLAEQLADGRDEVVMSWFLSNASVENFIQLVHGFIIKISAYYILDVLYLAHKYQVLTVLRQLEVQIKRYSDEDIRKVCFYSKHNCWMIKMLLGENYHKDVLTMNAIRELFPNLYWYVEDNFKSLNNRKRNMLLAITKAPFAHQLDADMDDYSETESGSLYCSSLFSVYRFFSKAFSSSTPDMPKIISL